MRDNERGGGEGRAVRKNVLVRLQEVVPRSSAGEEEEEGEDLTLCCGRRHQIG